MSNDEIKSIKVGDLNFSYFEQGSGPLVLCLHGYPDTAHSWMETLDFLAKSGFRAVAPFMRGYAPTDIPADGDYAVLRMAEDALGLIEALGETEAIIIGHDWGALTAYSAAALVPSKLKKIVAVDMPHPGAIMFHPRTVWKSRHIIGYQFKNAAIKRLRRNDFTHIDEIYRRWSPNWDFDPSETTAVKQAFSQPGRVEAALGYYWAFLEGVTSRSEKGQHEREIALKQISVPTLTILGDWGAVTPKQIEKTHRFFSSDYEVVQLDGIGHFLHREAPDRFFGLVSAFLK